MWLIDISFFSLCWLVVDVGLFVWAFYLLGRRLVSPSCWYWKKNKIFEKQISSDNFRAILHPTSYHSNHTLFGEQLFNGLEKLQQLIYGLFNLYYFEELCFEVYVIFYQHWNISKLWVVNMEIGITIAWKTFLEIFFSCSWLHFHQVLFLF